MASGNADLTTISASCARNSCPRALVWSREPKRITHESRRPAARAQLLRPVAVVSVPAGALDRQGGDDRAPDLLGLGMGDRDRQDAALQPHAQGHGPVRAGVLVGPV